LLWGSCNSSVCYVVVYMVCLGCVVWGFWRSGWDTPRLICWLLYVRCVLGLLLLEGLWLRFCSMILLWSLWRLAVFCFRFGVA